MFFLHIPTTYGRNLFEVLLKYSVISSFVNRIWNLSIFDVFLVRGVT